MYVAVKLYHGRKMVKIKRTESQFPNSGDQEVEELIFDETFSFGVSGRFFDSCSLSFSVLTHPEDSVEKGQSVGSTVLGPFMYARGEALQHWQEMLANPRNMVVRWHPLEPTKRA